jgi:two-component system, NarL family, invasion response regulator UvrY
MTTVALIDDHSLIRNALKELINRFDDFEVIIDASNGQEFINKLRSSPIPDIALLDINMPVMDGFMTANYLNQYYPNIKVLALTVDNEEESIIKMLRVGAVGYLLKDSETSQLKIALNEVVNKGYYHTELVTNTLMKSIKPNHSTAFSKPIFMFQSREEEFLKLACTELTYKEIADKMNLSPRTVDGYRENLFEKLELKSRVGLVLFAIKNGIVRV